MDTPPDWDLLAVVRSCSSTTATTTTTTATPTISTADLNPPPPQLTPFSQEPTSSSVFFQFSNSQHELLDICKPLICTTSNQYHQRQQPPIISQQTQFQQIPIISQQAFQQQQQPNISQQTRFQQRPSISQQTQFQQQPSISQQFQQQPNILIKPSHVIFGASSPSIGGGGGGTSNVQRAKKRKNLMKKVCHVPAEGLSSDMWAWRKYGQKPIKGSPYPRGYYRCSSSKGCLARKQVERNRSDPKMFIVTYTAEHNHPMPTHRNSLAGSTRQKPLSFSGTPPQEQPSCSSPSAASLSPLTEKSESKTEGDDLIKEEDDTTDMALSDLMLNDDFYVGFEQIDGGSDGSDYFSDQFSPSSEFPWLASSSATTAAGGS